MKLYKYKSLVNLEHALDIILYERLFCTSYDKLNDPFEGLFLTTIILSHPLVSSIKQYKNIEDLPFDLSRTRICSLSSAISDVRLWSHYADGHKGVVFEIDFSGIESQVSKVTYDDKLPTFGSTILTSPFPHEVLLHKTKHWAYEAEYRIIHSNEYLSITNRIRAIYTGFRISDFHYALLERLVPSGVRILRTKINKDEINVEPDEIATS
jgi:hypothetical protein